MYYNHVLFNYKVWANIAPKIMGQPNNSRPYRPFSLTISYFLLFISYKINIILIINFTSNLYEIKRGVSYV